MDIATKFKFKCKNKKLKEIRKERKSRRLTQFTLVIKHKSGKSFKQHLFTNILSDLIFIQMHTPIAVHTCACVSTVALLMFKPTAFAADVKIYVDTGALFVCSLQV